MNQGLRFRTASVDVVHNFFGSRYMLRVQRSRWQRWAVMVAVGVLLGGAFAVAQPTTAAAEPTPIEKLTATVGDMQKMANTVWTLIAGMLVFWMNAGFATLEAGL